MGKRLKDWIIGGIVGAIIGIIIGSVWTWVYDYHIFPIYNDIKVSIYGPSVDYETEGQTLKSFVKFASQLIEPESRYIITYSPDAASIVLGSGKYGPYETYFEMIVGVLDKNSNNLSYKLDTKQKTIHIYISRNGTK